MKLILVYFKHSAISHGRLHQREISCEWYKSRYNIVSGQTQQAWYYTQYSMPTITAIINTVSSATWSYDHVNGALICGWDAVTYERNVMCQMNIELINTWRV